MLDELARKKVFTVGEAIKISLGFDTVFNDMMKFLGGGVWKR